MKGKSIFLLQVVFSLVLQNAHGICFLASHLLLFAPLRYGGYPSPHETILALIMPDMQAWRRPLSLVLSSHELSLAFALRTALFLNLLSSFGLIPFSSYLFDSFQPPLSPLLPVDVSQEFVRPSASLLTPHTFPEQSHPSSLQLCLAQASFLNLSPHLQP